MLHTFRVREQKLTLIPAVLHLDNTARVQTINNQSNALLYTLIKVFKKITKIPLLANSSLNDKGEPIINTIEETLNFALRKSIEVIYINGQRIELINHDKYNIKEPLARRINLEKYDDKQKELILENLNPHGVLEKYLKVYCRLPLLKNKYNIKNKSDAVAFSKVAQVILDNQWKANGRSVHNNYLKSYYDCNHNQIYGAFCSKEKE